MPSSDMIASLAYVDAEAKVFARYGLRPSVRVTRLPQPATTLRAVEVGSGEPVLFLHGICLCSAHWAPLMAGLPSMRCIAVDMPGHGGSGGIDFTGVDLRSWHTGMLTGYLDQLGLDSAHLVGHSYGGMFGLWLAADAPERVRSVVALGTPSIAFGARPDPTLRALATRGLGPLSLSLPNPAFAYRRVLATSLGHHAVDAAPPELIRATYLGTRRGGFARTVSTYLREQFRGARCDPPRYVLDGEELARIHRPVLVIWGDHDDRYQPIIEGERKTALIQGSRFEMVAGGHEPWLDDTGPCAKLISRFIADNSGQSPRPGTPAASERGRSAVNTRPVASRAEDGPR